MGDSKTFGIPEAKGLKVEMAKTEVETDISYNQKVLSANDSIDFTPKYYPSNIMGCQVRAV